MHLRRDHSITVSCRSQHVGLIRWGLMGWLGLMIIMGVTPLVEAGMVGYPGVRLKPLQFRLGLTGDSFRTHFSGTEESEATTGRALVRVTMGLTKWSEIFAQVGQAEFNIDAFDFGGNFGLLYGGGARIRLLRTAYGQVGLTGQYLRFESDDKSSAGVKAEGEWEEFEIGLGIGTRQVSAFQFYGGVTYHNTNVTLKREPLRLKLSEDIPMRVFLGLHIYPLKDFPRGEFVVNFEARLVGETPQFTLGLQYQF